MAWSSWVGSAAAWCVDKVAEAAEADTETRNNLKAGTMAVVGGTVAVCTGDVIGGSLVAYKAISYASGEKPNGTANAIATVASLVSGDFSVDVDCLTDNVGDISVDVDWSIHDHSYHVELEHWTSDTPSHINDCGSGVHYSSGESLSASYYHDEAFEY